MRYSIFTFLYISLLSCQSSKNVSNLKLTDFKEIDTINPNTYTIPLHPNDSIFILDEHDNIVDTLIIN